MTMTAIIDVDNTLWQFCDAFYEELQKVQPAFPPIEQWTTFDFWVQYCSEREFLDAINAIHHAQDSDRYQPYPEAQGFLRSLNEQGYRVIIASHRLEGTRVPTERWLKRHGLFHDELHLSFDKTVLFGNAAVVVDDSSQTLETAAAHGTVAAGLLFPWNKTSAGNGFGLFRDLNEVLAYVMQNRRGLSTGAR